MRENKLKLNGSSNDSFEQSKAPSGGSDNSRQPLPKIPKFSDP